MIRTCAKASKSVSNRLKSSKRLCTTSASNAAPIPSRPESRFKMRYLLVGIVPFGGYMYMRHIKFNETLEESNDLVSTTYKEEREIIRRAQVTPETFRSLVESARRDFPDEMVPPEVFGEYFKQKSGSKGLDDWDILASLRNAHISNGKVELEECLIAAASLVYAKDPNEKLELAWIASKDSKSGFMTFEQFSNLLNRMERTGHIVNETLLRTIEYFPPRFGILDGRGIAQEFYKRLGLLEHHEINVDQFKQAASDSKFRKKVDIWYFEPKRLRMHKPSKAVEAMRPMQHPPLDETK